MLDLSDPKWTHYDLAMPELNGSSLESADPSVNASLNSASELRIQLPVVTSRLNCTANGRPWAYLTNTSNTKIVHVLQSVPGDCTPTDAAVENMRSLEAGNIRTGFLMTESRDVANFSSIEDNVDVIKNPAGCPTIYGVYGMLDPTNWNRTVTNNEIVNVTYHYWNMTDLNAFYCSPYLAQVEAEVTFSLPDFTITSAEVDDAAVAALAPSAVNKNAFQLSDLFSLDVNNAQQGLIAYSVYGKNVTEYFTSWDKLNAAMEDSYRIGVAQAMNFVGRILLPPQEDAATAGGPRRALNATAVFPSSYRAILRQDGTSTRLLEGLLGAMVLCALATFVLHGFWREPVLPAEPTSIGVVGALLAGSALAGPDGAVISRNDSFEQPA